VTKVFNSVEPVTPKTMFEERRKIIKQLAACALLPTSNLAYALDYESMTTDITPEKLTTSYNNYYEFTSNKRMVKHLSKALDTSNWQLKINGLVEKPIIFQMQDLLALNTVSRIYPFRCVEGWSAVIPWQGFELKALLSLVKPLDSAKFVKFTGYYNPEVMIGQRKNTLPWPYVEGLRLDEALHPLTIIATGMYDKPLPNQNGAPIRLVVPWKYGYKSIKAMTQITLTDQQPVSSWQQQVPSEYGFYGNVNPKVAHPRWSQRREVRLGEVKKRKTKLLNGFANELTDLYQSDELNELF
jgi:sulfoxide reductase catalytic subunit YedY